VDADRHTLKDASVIRPGEAKGHGMWIDKQFCADVAAASQAYAEKGLKARFGHPDMCSDALGTFLGRWKNLKAGEDGVVHGDLHLSATASESPKGDLRNYVEQMAAKEPDHFGTSIVFSRDWEAESKFLEDNAEEYDEADESGNPTGVKKKRFKSPDPENTSNLPHARISALHAADLVDDPAATEGMFSGAGGAALAAKVSEWLDTHPEVLTAFSDNPEMVEIVERYATQLRPFIDRYNANHPAHPAETGKPEGQPGQQGTAEPDPELSAQIETLTSKLKKAEDENTELKSKVSKMEADAKESEAALKKREDEAEKLNKEVDEAEKAREDAESRLAAIEAGQPPASSAPAENDNAGSWMERARKRK